MTSFWEKSTGLWRGTFLLPALLCMLMATGFRTAHPGSPVERAFRGHYEGNLTVPAGIPQQPVSFTVTGNATHLGHFVMASQGDLYLSELRLANGFATFTGTLGDKLHTKYTSQGHDNEDGTYTVIATHEIIGGTGKFEGATGDISTFSIATLQVTPATVTIAGKVRMEGTIIY